MEKTCPKCEGKYSVCACGTSHFYGSSSAEHWLSCAVANGDKPMGLFSPNDGIHFPSWEAPNGECPHCWHLEHPDKDGTRLSGFGEWARNGCIGQRPEGAW